MESQRYREVIDSVEEFDVATGAGLFHPGSTPPYFFLLACDNHIALDVDTVFLYVLCLYWTLRSFKFSFLGPQKSRSFFFCLRLPRSSPAKWFLPRLVTFHSFINCVEAAWHTK